MNKMLLFVFESTLCITMFYLFYKLVQKRVLSFRYNRVYPIGSFLSFIIPTIKIPIWIRMTLIVPIIAAMTMVFSCQTSVKDSPNVQTIMGDGKSYDGEIFTIVDEPPVAKGGMKAFYKYVEKETKYPEQAINDTIQGKVYVQFIVEKDGAISDVQVIRPIGSGCDEESIRVIANSPKWIPGKHKGEPVRVRLIMPITFVWQKPKENKKEQILKPFWKS